MKLTGKEIRICSLLALDTVFFLLELIIGYMSHSLALIADSFHMLNDIISLLVALWAVNVAKNRNADASYTYGWKRAEILGALVNAVFLVALCFTILIEAFQRLISPPEIENPKLVMYVGIAGLLSNFVGLVLFHDHGHSHGHSHGAGGDEHDVETQTHSHSHFYNATNGVEESNGSIDSNNGNIREVWPQSVVERISFEGTALLQKRDSDSKNGATKNKKVKSLNMHGVFLHVLGDALGNVGVIVAALFIWKTDYSWRFYSDPVVSLVITLIIFSSAIPLSRKCCRILLQATPSSISADAVQRDILSISGVRSVHDFHIWNLTESFFIASLHVQIDASPDRFSDIAKSIRSIFHSYGIHSATVQPEFIKGNASLDASRRFSMIAGGSSMSVDQESVDSSTQDPSPSAYGATAFGDRCLVDQAAKCNPNECLPK
ncbi:hypothetical protein HG536_0H01090 [Torulaspora globosa]|uniref:Uncharacterized protein n=1 Tax=Torulaspora globosa TaxID=48254 RepID=A0A7G3ZMJ8_9SACH|nr:uncharacterized protein HG536_0H01090 [Torulaspora globosa]QLL34734.1 hypothetical protein HG536_0H01090 [Torulaspora globosa]